MDGAFPVCKGLVFLAAGEVLLREWVLDSQERASERRGGILAALFWVLVNQFPHIRTYNSYNPGIMSPYVLCGVPSLLTYYRRVISQYTRGISYEVFWHRRFSRRGQ